jgi:serine/threonine protein kinase
LTDFGFAAEMVVAGKKQWRMTVCGTENWMAPEVMMGEPYDERADVFSFGVVCNEIITGHDGKHFRRLVDDGYALDIEHIYSLVPHDTPPGLLPLALECCRLSPGDRPDMKSVIDRLSDIEFKLPGTTHHTTHAHARTRMDLWC